MSQYASIGRIVHVYLAPPPGREFAGSPKAAIITAVWPDDRINAHVFLDGVNEKELPDHVYTVRFSEEPQPHTWRWPPRV